MNTKTPIYLRDLKNDIQTEYIREWAREKKNTLIVAYEEGIDIIVGYYEKNPEVAE